MRLFHEGDQESKIEERGNLRGVIDVKARQSN